MKQETKTIISDLKVIDGRKVTGIASVFGNIDSGGDRMFKGSFKKTLKEQIGRIKHLWQHDFTAPPIAVVREIREVSREELPENTQKKYPEATGGLLVTREYLDTPRGDEILEGIKAEAISEMSFAFNPTRYDYETIEVEGGEGETLIRNIREVRLWETSDVIWGMNAATSASKQHEIQLMDLARRLPFVNDLIKNGSIVPDQEFVSMLEDLLMSIRNAEPDGDATKEQDEIQDPSATSAEPFTLPDWETLFKIAERELHTL